MFMCSRKCNLHYVSIAMILQAHGCFKEQEDGGMWELSWLEKLTPISERKIQPSSLPLLKHCELLLKKQNNN